MSESDVCQEDVVRLLRHAARIVLERGLARGIIGDGQGRVCLNGALLAAREIGSFAVSSAALAAVDRQVILLRLPYQYRADGYGIRINPSIQWSNDWARDADEVAHVLKLTAETVELGERNAGR